MVGTVVAKKTTCGAGRLLAPQRTVSRFTWGLDSNIYISDLLAFRKLSTLLPQNSSVMSAPFASQFASLPEAGPSVSPIDTSQQGTIQYGESLSGFGLGVVVFDNVLKFTPTTSTDEAPPQVRYFTPNPHSTAHALASTVSQLSSAAKEGRELDPCSSFVSNLKSSRDGSTHHRSVEPNDLIPEAVTHYGSGRYVPFGSNSRFPKRQCIRIGLKGWNRAISFVPLSEPECDAHWQVLLQSLRERPELTGAHIDRSNFPSDILSGIPKSTHQEPVEEVVKYQDVGGHTFVSSSETT